MRRLPILFLTMACGATSNAPDDASTANDASVANDVFIANDAPIANDAAADAPLGSAYGPYDVAGPYAVTSSTIAVTGPHGSFNVVVYVPTGATAAPVVILSSGFFQTAAGYAPYAERMASWKIVTILRDDPALGEQTTAIVDDVKYLATTWLAQQNASGPLASKLDTGHVGLAGHSRGGQVAFLAAENGANARGVFGIDPVDTATNNVEARTKLATIGVPVAFVGETTDSTGTSACAPAADNYQVLYAAAASPAVSITAVNADHPMFEDPAHCTLCTLCTPGTADAAKVLAFTVRYATAFFASVLLNDTSVHADLSGAGTAADVTAGLVTVTSK